VGVNVPNATITSYRRADASGGDGRPVLSPELVTTAWPSGVPARVAPLSNSLRETLARKGIAASRLIEVTPGVLRVMGIVPRIEDRITLTPIVTMTPERLRVVELMPEPAPGIAGRGDLVRLVCTPIADGVS
jgi:hypothetical protein